MFTSLSLWLATLAVLAAVLLIWRRRQTRIDGDAILAEAERPLAEQANAGYMKRYASPDRRFVAVIASNEVRMSHWIETLAVFDVANNRLTFDLPHPWGVSDVGWSAEQRLRFGADCYPGDAPTVEVVLDPHTQTAQLRAEGEETTVPFRNVVSWLNGFYARHRRTG